MTTTTDRPQPAVALPAAGQPPGPAIEVEHLVKRYGNHVAVHDVSFTVAPGEVFGILGPNGAGKTSAVECLQGLRRPDGGRVRVLGLDPQADASALRRRIGSQLQDSALPDRMRVWEALDLFASLAPGGRDPGDLLEEWGLVDSRDRAFADLSGGQRQRLFVALALVGRPEVVFLDELTQGLDPAARRVAWSLVREVRDRGTTVVLVTHHMDEAQRLCDRLAVVAAGRVVAQGTAQELIARSGGGLAVRFATNRPDVSWLEDLEPVESVQRRGAQVEVRGHGPVLAVVAAALVRQGETPVDLRVEQPSLEDVYMQLTTPQEDRI
ncbi:MAG: ABC transporter ATP-binding protein [Actinomycetota bacterium]|nr:ABC transporter ATP-binding protein [Actinomycetota bacterium]